MFSLTDKECAQLIDTILEIYDETSSADETRKVADKIVTALKDADLLIVPCRIWNSIQEQVCKE